MGEIEDLEGSLLSFQGDDLFRPMHDRTVGLDGPTNDVVVVFQIDDDDLRRGTLRGLLAHTHIAVGFKCLKS